LQEAESNDAVLPMQRIFLNTSFTGGINNG
jgi:hypothetical protein